MNHVKPGLLSLAILATLAALTVGAVVHGSPLFSASAAGDAGPSGPPPTPTPGGSTGGAAPVQQRDYFAPLSVSGPAILHGTSLAYDWSSNSRSSWNGQAVLTEYWIEIGQGGSLGAFVGIYSVDGHAIQSIVQDATSMTVRFGEDGPRSPAGGNACEFKSASSYDALLRVMPQVVQLERLAAAGFVDRGPASIPDVPGVAHQPGSILMTAATAKEWDSANSPGLSRTLVFDPASHLLLRWSSVSYDSTGTLAAKHDEEYGAIEIIPAIASFSDLENNVIAEGPCHD